MTPENNQLILYSTPQGDIKVEVVFENETFWLSQKRMAELFGVDERTVNEHLKNIFCHRRIVQRFNYPEFPDSSNRRQNAALQEMWTFIFLMPSLL